MLRDGRPLLAAVSWLLLIRSVEVLENGLARTPPMGWMSWGYYMCSVDCVKSPHKCLNEALVMSVVDAFFTEGYQEAGYEYIIIDDCWAEKERDSEGQLVPDRTRFPRGMKFLADYIHSRGLKFGLYTSIGTITCMGYPGSQWFLEEDAQQFAKWEVDYIKVDGCYVSLEHLETAYIRLGSYLNATNRPMVYSCSWPFYSEYSHNTAFNYSKSATTCNLGRNFHDVIFKWQSVHNIIRYYESRAEALKGTHGPGYWHDPDMLVLGTKSLTEGESRVQMAVYSMLSAPMLLSCPMGDITPYEKKLLQNLDLIAIAQDPLGIMATPHKLSNKVTLWVKRHQPMRGDIYHSVSFAAVNFGERSTYVQFRPASYGLDYESYTVYNVLERDFVKNITTAQGEMFNEIVPAHDVLLFTLYPL